MDRYVWLPDIQSARCNAHPAFNPMDITGERTDSIKLGDHWWLYPLGYRPILPAP